MSARNDDAIASVAPQQTVISRSGSTSIPYHCRYFSAIASRRRRRAPRDRVLVDVVVDRRARRVLHRLGHREIGQALRQVDRAVLVRHARHLADHRLGERAGATGCSHARSCAPHAINATTPAPTFRPSRKWPSATADLCERGANELRRGELCRSGIDHGAHGLLGVHGRVAERHERANRSPLALAPSGRGPPDAGEPATSSSLSEEIEHETCPPFSCRRAGRPEAS